MEFAIVDATGRETSGTTERRNMAIIKKTLENIDASYHDQSDALRGMFGTTLRIDEMAVMFPTLEMAAQFIKYAVRLDGYTMFNTAYDSVMTEPIPSAYEVEYFFLTTPGYEQSDVDASITSGYRLEIMVPSKGSPLHDNIRHNMAGGVYRPTDEYGWKVHASFKCGSEEEYGDANHALSRGGYACAQRCLSDYGKFSYWNTFEAANPEAINPWFMKPRLNQRDAK